MDKSLENAQKLIDKWIKDEPGYDKEAYTELFKYKDKKMNQEQYLKYHEEIFLKAFALTKNKNSDYIGNNKDTNAFYNLELIERMGFSSTEIGILTRIVDKFARIKSFLDKGVLLVLDEKIEDTIIDAINYLILLSAYISNKKKKDA